MANLRITADVIRVSDPAIGRSAGASPRDNTLSEFDVVSSCELPQETQVVLREEADIGNIEQNHRQSVHPKTESKSGPFFRIVSAVAAGLGSPLENRRERPSRRAH